MHEDQTGHTSLNCGKDWESCDFFYSWPDLMLSSCIWKTSVIECWTWGLSRSWTLGVGGYVWKKHQRMTRRTMEADLASKRPCYVNIFVRRLYQPVTSVPVLQFVGFKPVVTMGSLLEYIQHVRYATTMSLRIVLVNLLSCCHENTSWSHRWVGTGVHINLQYVCTISYVYFGRKKKKHRETYISYKSG